MKAMHVDLGDTVSFGKTVGETDVYMFAGVTGDFSGNHVDEVFMQKSKYGQRIAHGALMVGYMSTASTMMIERSLAKGIDSTPVSLGYDRVRFLAPVFFGDTIRVTYTIAEIEEERRRTRAKVEVRNQHGGLVAVGEHLLKWVQAERRRGVSTGMSMVSLAGKTAIITGGASGIGRAIGFEMVASGCAVGLLDRDGHGLQMVADEFEAQGCTVFTAVADVADAASIGAGVESLAGKLGRLDILVNGAGILRLGKIEALSFQDWNDTQRINVDGLFHTTRAAIPHLRRQGAGRIINLSSWMGKSGKAYYGAYCASKFAIIGLTETLALELAEDGITVNAICPGIIMQTGMRDRAEAEQQALGLPSAEERIATIPLKRLGQPQDVAAIAAFLASDSASYMTGHTVNVTGGMWLK